MNYPQNYVALYPRYPFNSFGYRYCAQPNLMVEKPEIFYQKTCTQNCVPQQPPRQPMPHPRWENSQFGHHHQQFGANTQATYGSNAQYIRVPVTPTLEMQQNAAYYTGQPLFYQNNARPLPAFQNCLFVNQGPPQGVQPLRTFFPVIGPFPAPSPGVQFALQPNYYSPPPCYASNVSASPVPPQYQVPPNYQEPSVDDTANANHEDANYPSKCSSLFCKPM